MSLEDVRKLYPELKQIGRVNQRTLAPYFHGDGAIIDQVEPGTRIQATLLFDFDKLREIRYSRHYARGDDLTKKMRESHENSGAS